MVGPEHLHVEKGSACPHLPEEQEHNEQQEDRQEHPERITSEREQKDKQTGKGSTKQEHSCQVVYNP